MEQPRTTKHFGGESSHLEEEGREIRNIRKDLIEIFCVTWI
jgi:hypothetical protein